MALIDEDRVRPMGHDARAHIAAFVRQIEAEYHADDLAEIASAVAPVGYSLGEDRDLTPEQLASYLLRGDPFPDEDYD